MTSKKQLQRYGLQWNGPKDFVSTPMPDGYWTPWHVAQAEIDRLRAALEFTCEALGSDSIEYDDVRNIERTIDETLAGSSSSAEQQCRMFCAWKGGGPCLAEDCPRRTSPSTVGDDHGR